MTAKTDWQGVYGASYLPSYARNATETWARFDRDVVDRELGFAQDLGLNSIRIWLDNRPYEDDPLLMLSHVEEFLDLCEKHDLTAVLILFDSCGVEEKDLKEHGETFDTHWRRWTPSPGYDRLGPEHWDSLEKYVEGIVGAHLNDSRVLIWEVMNEPWAAGMWDKPEKGDRVERFVRHFCQRVADMKPDAPLTIGLTAFNRVGRVDDLVDVTTFHSYVEDAQEVAAILEEANTYAREGGKPIVFTEWGFPCWRFESTSGRIIPDEEQEAQFEKTLPVLMESKIGWYIFDLIMGYGPFARISLLRPNGDKRPAALLVEKHLKMRGR